MFEKMLYGAEFPFSLKVISDGFPKNNGFLPYIWTQLFSKIKSNPMTDNARWDKLDQGKKEVAPSESVVK